MVIYFIYIISDSVVCGLKWVENHWLRGSLVARLDLVEGQSVINLFSYVDMREKFMLQRWLELFWREFWLCLSNNLLSLTICYLAKSSWTRGSKDPQMSTKRLEPKFSTIDVFVLISSMKTSILYLKHGQV